MAKARNTNTNAADTTPATDGTDLVPGSGQETLESPENTDATDVVNLDLVEGEADEDAVEAAIQAAIQEHAQANQAPAPTTAADVYEITNNGGAIPAGWSFDARHPDGYFPTPE